MQTDYKEVMSAEYIYAANVANVLIDSSDAAASLYKELSLYGKVSATKFEILVENFRALFNLTHTYIPSKVIVKKTEDFFRSGLSPPNSGRGSDTDRDIEKEREEQHQKILMRDLSRTPTPNMDPREALRKTVLDIQGGAIAFDCMIRERAKKGVDKKASGENSFLLKNVNRAVVVRALNAFDEYSEAIYHSPLMKLIRETASIQEQ